MDAPLTHEELDLLLSVPYTYTERPRPTPADGRPIWRVPYVVLLVGSCRSQRASVSQMHVLNWALRSTTNSQQLRAFLRGGLDPDRPVIRYEPALDRAIALASGMGLLRFSSRLWELTSGGRGLMGALDEEPELLAHEREQLSGLGGALTQKAVGDLLKRV